MATVRTSLDTAASADDVWSVIRDIGAVHTRLAPGFVTDTKLEPGARVVTFVNGMVIREPIVTIDDEARRLVWSAEGGYATHYQCIAAGFGASRRRRDRRLGGRLPAGRRQAAIDQGARSWHASDEAVARRAGEMSGGGAVALERAALPWPQSVRNCLDGPAGL